MFGTIDEHAIQERINIVGMFKALNIPTLEVKTTKDLLKIKDVIIDLKGPCIVELVVDHEEESPFKDRVLMLKKNYSEK